MYIVIILLLLLCAALIYYIITLNRGMAPGQGADQKPDVQ